MVALDRPEATQSGRPNLYEADIERSPRGAALARRERDPLALDTRSFRSRDTPATPCARHHWTPLDSSRGDYIGRLRIAAKPTIARSAASMTNAHSESVGMFTPAKKGGTGTGPGTT